MKRKDFVVSLGVALATLLLGSGSLPAVAEEPEATAAEVKEAVAEASPEALNDAAPVATDSEGSQAIDTTVNGTEISVPTDPAKGIAIDPTTGPEVKIGLPSAASSDDAEVVKPGVVAYDNNNGSTTVPVVKTDGSVAVNLVISGPEAPTEYKYPLTVPEGAILQLAEGGGAQVIGGNGDIITAVAPAWAKDSNESPVATHFVVQGTDLMQVVEHRAEGVVYPVVADPWFIAAAIATVQAAAIGCTIGFVKSVGWEAMKWGIRRGEWYWRDKLNRGVDSCLEGAVYGVIGRFVPWALKGWVVHSVRPIVVNSILWSLR